MANEIIRLGKMAQISDYSKVPTKELLKDVENHVPVHYGLGVRHIQLVIFFICMSVSFIARAHVGVSIVAMTNIDDDNTSASKEQIATNIMSIKENELSDNETVDKSYIQETKRTGDEVKEKNDTEDGTDLENISKNVMESEHNAESQWGVLRTYNWSKPVQEMILSAFFLGYCIMMFPIGMVCQRWGGKVPLQISLFVNGVLSILTPWLALWGGWKAVCLSRILQGMSQSGTFPGIQTLLAKWVPADERASLSCYVYTGTTIGSVIAFQLGGVLADSRWGWPSSFWAVGVICLMTFAALTFFGSATPLEHSSISHDEKNYILGHVDDGIVKNRKTPWKSILTSKPVWGSFAAHTGSGVAFVFFFTQVPSYIHYILGIDVKSSGLLTSLPYVVSFFTSITFGFVSDLCTNRKIVSVKNARRISNSVSLVGVAVSLILASFTTSAALAVCCLVVAMGCYMAIHTGWMVNHIDLSPNYSGTIMSIGNIVMNFFLLLLPVLVSHIVIDVRNQFQWRIMFFLVAGLALICNTIFVILMSSETQPWNDYKEESTPDDPVSETVKEK